MENEQLRIMQELNRKMGEFTEKMQNMHIAEYVQLMSSPRKIILPSLIGGISRGVGIAIGLTLVTSTILYLLRALGALDLPIVGDYIADIVRHVQAQLEGHGY